MTGTLGTTYELRVAEHLDHHWSHVLAGLDIRHLPDGTCILTGTIADQAQLHGVLTSLQDIGATLLALHAVTPAREFNESECTPRVAMQRVLADLEWPVHTERLTLRPARPEDAEPTWMFRRLEAVGRWLTELPVDREAYRAMFTRPDRLATTLVIERGDQVIGDLMLRIEDAWAQKEVTTEAAGIQAELGWVLDPAHTGAGYATEAVGELLRICFTDLGLRRVTASCFSANEASWQLMERLGMRRELHAVSDALHRSGSWADTLGYALLAEEWTPRARTSADPVDAARGGR